MSAARMTYLILIPAVIAMIVPILAMAFPQHLTSRRVLDTGLIISVLLILSYAVGLGRLALRDHRRISRKRLLLER